MNRCQIKQSAVLLECQVCYYINLSVSSDALEFTSEEHGLALFLYIEIDQGETEQCSAISPYSDEDAVMMQAAQANNNSYGGHSYPHTYEHHMMMDRGWSDHRIGELHALSSSYLVHANSHGLRACLFSAKSQLAAMWQELLHPACLHGINQRTSQRVQIMHGYCS